MITDKIEEALNGDLKEYRAIPFWSWNNDLDEEELVKQIEDMKEAGMGGFIMHARTGLNMEYLGEKWFRCIKVCLDKAKELNMNGWIYDENGWPSGFAGGKLLENEEYLARFLTYKVNETFDNKAYATYKQTEMGYTRIYEEENGVNEYHSVYMNLSPSNSDILNPKVVDAFIEETHEQYYKRFKDSFGKELVGFFTDEPQFYRYETPYTPVIDQVFRRRFNEDVTDGLIYLFVKDERGYSFREKYYQTLNYMYAHNFYEKIYNWCKAHNCKLTGHSVEEPYLYTQMWGGAGCSASYEFEDIPAIDWLGRECGGNELSPKQVGSVASQLGKKHVLTETFGCSGYDVIPSELKSVAEYQYFNGVNMMCHHLYAYSVSRQGRVDNPPVFSPHSNWKEGFKTFNEYFTRLGYIISNTKENTDVLVIHPMRSVYLDYIREKDYLSIKELEDSFALLLSELRANGIQFHLGDEGILEKYGQCSGDKIIVGECSYDKIIVPDMRTISNSTYNLLKEYKGKILFKGKLSYIDGKKADISLKSNLTMEDIIKERKVKFVCQDGKSFMTSRKSQLGDFIFIKNSSRTEKSDIVMEGVGNHYKKLDLMTLKTENITDKYTLNEHDSLILIKCENVMNKTVKRETEDITNKFTVNDISENYLVIDYGEMSYDGINFSEKMPLPQLFENLLREDYRGKLYIKQTFFLKEKMPLKLIMENEKIYSAKVNGKEIKFTKGNFDVFFNECDITDCVKVGKNEFIYKLDYYQHEGVHFALFDPLATESLRNCLYFDNQIENIYIKGDFVLDENFIISKRTKLPEITNELYKSGYPFFKGELTLKGKYDNDGKGKKIINLCGRFVMAMIEINGEKTDITLSTNKDITKYLKKGENHITLKLRSSLRNIFGPHHYKPQPEPLGVNPLMFTMRGDWKNGVPPQYTHNYNFVNFGVKKIEIITEQ